MSRELRQDQGAPLQRNKRDGFFCVETIVLRFWPEQLADAEEFFEDVGGERFEMPVYIGGAWVDCEVQIQNGRVTWRRSGPRWAASFTREVVRRVPAP